MLKNQNGKVQAKRVGFYRLIHDDELKAIIGALLVLNEVGKPEEFRVTLPVKPTLIQRQLYGESLLPHVGIELCGKPLVDMLKTVPDLLVINPIQLLGLAEAITVPTVYVERAGESFVVNVPSATEGAKKQKVQSASGRFEPLSVSYPTTYNQADCASAATLVSDFFTAIDLLEPFNRITIAIQTLRTQDERFR
ncbi:MAG: hypothetical protein R3E79_24095 [Caldilineaceae bacterium]